jgi:hypothetical protein
MAGEAPAQVVQTPRQWQDKLVAQVVVVPLSARCTTAPTSAPLSRLRLRQRLLVEVGVALPPRMALMAPQVGPLPSVLFSQPLVEAAAREVSLRFQPTPQALAAVLQL